MRPSLANTPADSTDSVVVVTRPGKEPSRFDNKPAAPLELAGELFGRDAAQQLLGVGESHFRFSRLPCHLVRSRLQSSDDLVCLGTRGLAGSLALREPHRPARIPEALVTCRVQEVEELVHLT